MSSVVDVKIRCGHCVSVGSCAFRKACIAYNVWHRHHKALETLDQTRISFISVCRFFPFSKIRADLSCIITTFGARVDLVERGSTNLNG